MCMKILITHIYNFLLSLVEGKIFFMTKESITFNNIAKESTKESFVQNPDDLLKNYLKQNDITGNNETNPALTEPQDKPDQSNDPEIAELTQKLTRLKANREEFNKNPDLNLLNEYLPHRNALPDKEKYDALVNKILQKAKFQMSDEEFGKDTELSGLTKLKPMDSFLSHLVAGSIVDLYLNREDLIDSVLNRPEGFTLVALQRQKDSGAVGLYESNSNYILTDGAAVIMGMLNLKGKDNATEQLDVIKHEFTHAVDASKNSYAKTDGEEKLAYIATGLLPGMDKQTEEKAFNEIKTSNNGIEKYAGTNIQEFLATTMETFVDNPLALPESIRNMYTNYLKFDPIKEQKTVV